MQQGHNPVVGLLLPASYSFELQCHVFYLPLNTSMQLRYGQHLQECVASWYRWQCLSLRKVWQSLRCITMLEEFRTTTIAGNKAITAAPAQDGLTIIIYKNSVKGNTWTIPNGIKNKGWIYLGFLTGAKLIISEIFVIIIHFCLYWYFNNNASTLICQ